MESNGEAKTRREGREGEGFRARVKESKEKKNQEESWGARDTVDHVLRHSGRALWDSLEGSSRDRDTLQLGLMYKSVAVCVEGACEVGGGGFRYAL